MTNGFPFFPIRIWVKKGLPGESIIIKIAISKISGVTKGINNNASDKSKVLLITKLV